MMARTRLKEGWRENEVGKKEFQLHQSMNECDM
jgi:hypothetical protein